MSASGYDFQRHWQNLDEQNAAMNDPNAFQARRGAMLDAQMAREKQLHGSFDQNADLKRQLEGTWQNRAAEQRALQGTWQDRAAQEREVQGTFKGRESGLNLRQENQLEAEMARARLADTGATERTRMSEEGSTGRTRMGQEGENWRRMYEPTHYGEETNVDAMGNTIRRTVPYQYGQPINQGQPSILSKVAPAGFKDVDHFISAYQSVPQDNRSQFLMEAQAAHPDLFVAARNRMQDMVKGGTQTPAAGEPSNPSRKPTPLGTVPATTAGGMEFAQDVAARKPAASVPPPPPAAPINTVAPTARPYTMPDREARFFEGTTTGGDINPVTFPRRPERPTVPDLSYVTNMPPGGVNPEERFTPPPAAPVAPVAPSPAVPARRFISPYLTGTEQGLPKSAPSGIQNPDLGPASVPSRMPPSYPRPLMSFPMPEEPASPSRRFVSPYLSLTEQGLPSPPPARSEYVEPEKKPRKKVFRTPFMY
jgi:hypothetical protein